MTAPLTARTIVDAFLRSRAASEAMLDAFRSTGVAEDRNLAATMLENLLDAAYAEQPS